MADNSFGIKTINLVGSGTPKLESLGNLNLNAVNVAISTNATIGGTLNVTGISTFTNVSIGETITATSYSGGGDGSLVAAKWTLGQNGSNHYTFTGPGGLSEAFDPTIYLARM